VFGYLLSQALFARFHEEGAAFLPRYEAFLAMTGSASCEEAARRTLDADITRKDFWGGAVRAISPILAAAEA
jgi:oligoendopeptidase F